MRKLQLETAIWKKFTSTDFYEMTADEYESVAEWFSTLARSGQVEGFGRNSQIYDLFKRREVEFRRGAELARLGDYEPIWKVAGSARGDGRGILDQPLHTWMTKEQAHDFEFVKMDKLYLYKATIELPLNNAMYGAYKFFNPDEKYPKRREDDDGFPGEGIVDWYFENSSVFDQSNFWKLPDPIPEYVVDRSISCSTGDEVPMTGVWYPATGLDDHSLTFAVKGRRMQPAYRVIKSRQQLHAEGVLIPKAQTVAVATVWHPVIESPDPPPGNTELWAKAGQQCPKEGIWQPTDPGAARRYYRVGEPMLNLGSSYGFTVWRWMADR